MPSRRSFRATARGRFDSAARLADRWSSRLGAGSIAVALGMTGVAVLLGMSLLLSTEGDRHRSFLPTQPKTSTSPPGERVRGAPIAVEIGSDAPPSEVSDLSSAPAGAISERAAGSASSSIPAAIGLIRDDSLASGPAFPPEPSAGDRAEPSGYEVEDGSETDYHSGPGERTDEGEAKAVQKEHEAKAQKDADKEQRKADKDEAKAQKDADKEQRKADKAGAKAQKDAEKETKESP